MNPILTEKKLVILDRDGVINRESPDFIKSPEEWIPIPGSLEAIAALTAKDIRIAIATNQSGVARGLYDEAMLKNIHQTMLDQVTAQGGKIDYISYCPHHPDEGCDCRKPKTLLLDRISEHFSVALSGVPFIGDSEKDVLAGVKKGCHVMLLQTGYGNATREKLPQDMDIPIYKNLQAAVAALLA